MRILLYLALGLILSPKLSAEDAPLVWDEKSVGDDWDRAIRGFRRDHNVALLLGQTRTLWDGRTKDLPEVRAKNSATELTLQYSFHIPWGLGLGYSLGTSSSIQVDHGQSSVSTHYRAMLPGLDFCLVWNATNALRFNLGVSFGWERVDGLEVEGQEGHMSLTEESLSEKIAIDYFWTLTWGVRIEYVETQFPGNASLDYDLEKNIRRGRLGLIIHLL